MSRAKLPELRTPSTKMLPLVSKPRSLKLLVDVEKPFSPASKVMPGVVRSAWVRLVAPRSLMIVPGMTVTVCGVSSSGPVILLEET